MASAKAMGSAPTAARSERETLRAPLPRTLGS